ncbi:transcription elongation factor GreA [bacterium BMS3Bbin04]|nr:transcription elongation factor GreA [bacterium BMS3Bbin04]
MNDRVEAVRKELQQEIAVITRELEVDLPVRIDEARQKGDLSENAEYEAAKERQNYCAIRLQQLRHRHMRLATIDLNDVDKNTVGLYSVVDLEEIESNKKYTYELVLAEEMNVKKGMISILSPIGQQLRGTKPGQTVTIKTPARTFDLKVHRFTNILGERLDA